MRERPAGGNERTMTKRKAKGAAEFDDPYESMSDDQLDAYVHDLYVKQREQSVPVSLRMPSDLLQRVKAVAATSHVKYQTLMKGMIERGTADLEKRIGTKAR